MSSSIVTSASKTEIANIIVNQYQYWLALGKILPWVDEDNPPTPSPNLRELPEVYGFCFVHNQRLVYPDRKGLIKTLKGNYAPALDGRPATSIYYEAALLPNTVDRVLNYRALALCYRLSFNATPGVINYGTFVKAADVDSYVMDTVITFKAASGNFNQTQLIQIVKDL